MNETIIPRAAAPPASRTLGPVDRLARAALRASLRRLPEGRLTIADAEGTVTCGSGEGLAATVRVEDPRFYRAVLGGGSLGAAEAYIRGLWTCDTLVDLLRLFARNLALTDGLEGGAPRLAALPARLVHAVRRNSKPGSRRNIRAHYDLGNDLFELFLDETMTYSCGIFPRPDSSLRDASIEKLDTVCRKLELRPGDRVLEIGTGWGSFALHAARHYGCHVTTTTISARQHDAARRRIREAGFEDRIDLRLADYRELEGRYDKIASIEMIEAVGHRYLDEYFRRCGQRLEPGGLMVLQAITMPDQRYARYLRSVDFIQRHVFPGSCLPSLGAMTRSIARTTRLRVVGLEDITAHYVTTLRRWRRRFHARVEDVRRLGYPDEFVRLWEFYLCYCEAGFAERSIADVQVVLAGPEHGRGEAA